MGNVLYKRKSYIYPREERMVVVVGKGMRLLDTLDDCHEAGDGSGLIKSDGSA